MSTSAAIHTDKSQVLAEQPTEIVGRLSDLTETLRKLKAQGVEFIEGDAEEEPIEPEAA